MEDLDIETPRPAHFKVLSTEAGERNNRRSGPFFTTVFYRRGGYLAPSKNAWIFVLIFLVEQSAVLFLIDPVSLSSDLLHHTRQADHQMVPADS